ncbi:hypothetical protein KL930_004927 [Ogataea haglerorum]|uniref:Uncharacterized protein n=1 Tax=Ogataea haglerorum TaxID=1937702 RepID=A0AAN6DA02_9ASCO|nr:hypothetical protein KL951_001535 [Ogataea haglerorum]KAG7726644.1 hypothetical protein KL948_004626 [Ogataea haglerorum]KAG7729753.1 hypothetical protein KL933_000833 [Ogataea haglerorum]KAG7735387.1 hypothetical protein KL932_004594 [Ogataea haglerorum]KAG7736326.1 hypothetical protein KL923_004792 [Ogataea haglerorum]
MNYYSDSGRFHDGHCHLSPSINAETFERFRDVISHAFCHIDKPLVNLMSTNHIDLHFIYQLALEIPAVFPSYGIHPWYSHLFSTVPVNTEEEKRNHYHEILNPAPSEELLANLPMPIYLEDHTKTVEQYLEAGGAIGEIGLDKAFRVPNSGFMGPSENSGLSPCRVSMDHQIKIFETFLWIAQAKNRPVSIHCVGCHGKLLDSVQKIMKSPGLQSSELR